MDKSEANNSQVRGPSTNNNSTNWETTLTKTINADISDITADQNKTRQHQSKLDFVKQAMNVGSLNSNYDFLNPQTGTITIQTWDEFQNKIEFQFDEKEANLMDLSQINQDTSLANQVVYNESQMNIPDRSYVCKPIKVNIKALGDTKYQQIEAQKRRDKELRIQNIFHNLSSTPNLSQQYRNLKPYNRSQLLSQLDDKIAEHRKKAQKFQEEKQRQFSQYDKKAEHSRQRLETYHQQLARNQSLRELTLSEKLTKAEKTLEKLQKTKQDNFEIRQEMVKKRILRAKIVNILQHKTPILCQEYLNRQDRVTMFSNKYKQFEKQKQKKTAEKGLCYRNPYTHEIVPGLGDLKDQSLLLETPDEVFVNHFTEDDLQMIQEDPNYFITDMRYKDLITLFDQDTLDSLLDNEGKKKLKTYKEKYQEQQIELKRQKCDEQKRQMMEKFHSQTMKFGIKPTLQISEEGYLQMDVEQHHERLKQETLRLRYNQTQPHSPSKSQSQILFALEKIRNRDELHRQKMERKLKDKMQEADSKKQREMLKAMNKVLDLRDKQHMKYSRIQENRKLLKEDQELMKNFYSKIEENCMKAQVSEIQHLMKEQKLKPVKNHLEKWKVKVGLTKNEDGVYQNYSQFIKTALSQHGTREKSPDRTLL